MDRPSWNETFMAMAQIIARRGTCPRLQAGAVIVNDQHRLLSLGYNGAPSGLEHCTDVGCQMEGGHCVRTVHAEINAIATAANIGVSIRGGTLYLTARPCIRCSQVLINSGLSRVIYGTAYDSDNLRDEVALLYDRAGVTYEQFLLNHPLAQVV